MLDEITEIEETELTDEMLEEFTDGKGDDEDVE